MFKGGFSGGKLELLPNGIIRKWAILGQEDRLRRQVEKQQKFENNRIFKVPKVLEICKSYFDMEYIRGLSVIEFLNRASKKHLDLLFVALFSFVAQNFSDLPNRDYKLEIQEKLSSLGVNMELPATIILPTGINHGDLSLTNLIYSSDKFYLIDFLDAFIDSPILDLIKIRQDTHLYWCLYVYGETNNIRAKLALDYLDRKLLDMWDIPYYNELQKINLYRILPYTRTSEERDFIYKKLSELC